MKIVKTVTKIALLFFIIINCSISSYLSYKLLRSGLPSKEELSKAEAEIIKGLDNKVADCSEYVKDIQTVVDVLVQESLSSGEKRACEFKCSDKELFGKYVGLWKKKGIDTPRDFVAALGEGSVNPFFKCADSKYFLKIQNKKSKLIAMGAMAKMLAKNKSSTETADEKKIRSLLDGSITDCNRYKDSISAVIKAFVEREMKDDPSAKKCKFVCGDAGKFKEYVDAFKQKNDAFQNNIEKWAVAFGESSSSFVNCD